MVWALEIITRIYGRFAEPMKPWDVLDIEEDAREKLFKSHMISSMLLLQQHDRLSKGLRMLFLAAAEILRV